LQSALPDLADLLSKVLHQCDTKSPEGFQIISNDGNSAAEIHPSCSPGDSTGRRIFMPVQEVCFHKESLFSQSPADAIILISSRNQHQNLFQKHLSNNKQQPAAFSRPSISSTGLTPQHTSLRIRTAREPRTSPQLRCRASHAEKEPLTCLHAKTPLSAITTRRRTQRIPALPSRPRGRRRQNRRINCLRRGAPEPPRHPGALTNRPRPSFHCRLPASTLR
jgi:hypothetical protein